MADMTIIGFPLESSLRAPADSSQTLQVIGAGFSRTGTVSFNLALEELLGGPVCHGGSACLLREEAFIKQWIAVSDPKLDDETVKAHLKDLLTGYVGITDNPCIMYTRELVEMYPDAKVICTTRDPEKWAESISAVVDRANLTYVDILFSVMPTLRLFGKWRKSMKVRRSVIYPEANEVPDDSDFLSYYRGEVLEIHHNYLKRVVPPDRLFFVDVKDGWEPLCKILGRPVPKTPFPRTNDQVAMKNAFSEMYDQALVCIECDPDSGVDSRLKCMIKNEGGRIGIRLRNGNTKYVIIIEFLARKV